MLLKSDVATTKVFANHPKPAPSIPFQGESQCKPITEGGVWGKPVFPLHCYIRWHFHTMIPGNARLPATAKETVTTVNDNQRTAAVVIYQGERKLAEENLLVGTLRIKDIKPARAGYPRFEVTVNIDANNSVSLAVHNFQSGEVQQASFTTALEESEVADHFVQAKAIVWMIKPRWNVFKPLLRGETRR